MRTVSSAELALLSAAHVNHHVRIEVQNQNGTWRDLTNLNGIDWVEEFEIDGENIDRPTTTAKLQLRRDVPSGNKSLSPLWTASPLNVNNSGAYAPLLDLGRAVRITTAVTAAGVAPVTADWKEMFLGRIDAIAWEASPIVVDCSDQYAWIVDRFIEYVGTFGSNAGQSLEGILAALLAAWPPLLGAPTIYTPSPTGWIIPSAFPSEKKSVAEMCKSLVDQIGWEFRYRYDASDVNRLTLFQPPRTKSVSDATISPSMYRTVQKLDLAIQDIRNAIVVTLITGGAADATFSGDSTSQLAYGRRYMEIPSGGNIDHTQAQALGDAALSDLKAPKAEQDVELLYWWPAQLYDLYTFPANADHYDTDQQLAVVGVKHVGKAGEIITTLTCRGTVAGAYSNWLIRGKTGGDPNYISPKITLDRIETSTLGTLTITIVDPQSRVTKVEAQTAVAGGAPGAWGTLALSGGVYTKTVTITPGFLSTIAYRITAVDVDGVERVIRGEVLSFGLAIGPSLIVTPTYGSASASIAYTSPTAVTLSINGSTPTSAPASPIVVSRPAAGGVPLPYTFYTVLNGQTESDTIFIQPIDADTATPILDVPPGTTTNTTVIFTPTATNPKAGGAAPTLTMMLKGTSATSAGGSVVYADGSTTVIASGTMITAARAPFSSTATQATISFYASIAGSGAAEISRTVLNQVKTSFGPSLVVTPSYGTSSVSIGYTYTGTLSLTINGASTSVPGTNPFTVTRPTTTSDSYVFTATLDGVTQSATVVVDPPIGASSGPTFTYVSIFVSNYSTDQMGLDWGVSGAPAGASYIVTIFEQSSISNPKVGQTFTATASAPIYYWTANNDIDSAGVRTKKFTGSVQMISGATVVATSTTDTATVPSN